MGVDTQSVNLIKSDKYRIHGRMRWFNYMTFPVLASNTGDSVFVCTVASIAKAYPTTAN